MWYWEADFSYFGTTIVYLYQTLLDVSILSTVVYWVFMGEKMMSSLSVTFLIAFMRSSWLEHTADIIAHLDLTRYKRPFRLKACYIQDYWKPWCLTEQEVPSSLNNAWKKGSYSVSINLFTIYILWPEIMSEILGALPNKIGSDSSWSYWIINSKEM